MKKDVKAAKGEPAEIHVLSIEETFEELEQLIEKLESGESSLEESFAYYEAGIKLVKLCSEKIDKVEKQIIILSEDGGDHDQ